MSRRTTPPGITTIGDLPNDLLLGVYIPPYAMNNRFRSLGWMATSTGSSLASGLVRIKWRGMRTYAPGVSSENIPLEESFRSYSIHKLGIVNGELREQSKS